MGKYQTSTLVKCTDGSQVLKYYPFYSHFRRTVIVVIIVERFRLASYICHFFLSGSPVVHHIFMRFSLCHELCKIFIICCASEKAKREFDDISLRCVAFRVATWNKKDIIIIILSSATLERKHKCVQMRFSLLAVGGQEGEDSCCWKLKGRLW